MLAIGIPIGMRTIHSSFFASPFKPIIALWVIRIWLWLEFGPVRLHLAQHSYEQSAIVFAYPIYFRTAV